MRTYKDQIDVEKEQWIENYMKKQETQLLTKERQLKEGVKDSRDKEIEMVISRLEEEATKNREEAEKTAENRIKYAFFSNNSNLLFTECLYISISVRLRRSDPDPRA